MWLWALAFSLGICAGYFVGTSHLIVILVAVIITACAAIRQQHLRILLCLLLGCAWFTFCLQGQLARQLPKSLEAKDLIVTGTIVSVPQKGPHRTRFEFKIDRINQVTKNYKARLSWYSCYFNLGVGQRWQLKIRIKRPHGFANPGGFNFARWALQHQIQAIGYVKSSDSNKVLQPAAAHYLNRLRQHLARSIDLLLHDGAAKGIIKALTIGIKHEIKPEQWQAFRGTGTSHLIAISGLHIGLIAGLVFMVIGFFSRRLSWLVLHIPAQQLAAVGSLVGALFYAGAAGFSIPTQRALIMIAVLIAAQLFRRNLPTWHAFSVALIVVLLRDPLAIFSAGFWLSFGAVAVILYGMMNRVMVSKTWLHWMRVHWVVGLGLMPLSLLLFQQVSVVTIFANAIAIPWVGLVVVPLSLLACISIFISLPVAKILFLLAEKLLLYLLPILSWLGNLPHAQWSHSVAHLEIFIALCFATLLWLAPRGWPGKYLSVMGLIPLLFPTIEKPAFGDAWFTLLDVGQGLSAIVQTKSHSLLFDTGPKFNTNFDTGAAVILPFLRQKNINELSMLVVSHGDNDHIGGAGSVMQNIKVKQILTSVPQRLKHARYCQAGQHWIWDGVEFRMLYPDPDHLGLGNNSSCVLMVSAQGKRILIPGDIEKLAEKALLHTYGNHLASDILVAAHHGSKTSSSSEFVKAVNPDYVLFAVGYFNRFHFPHRKIVTRYSQLDIKQLDTSRSGAITFKLEKGLLKSPAEYRANQ